MCIEPSSRKAEVAPVKRHNSKNRLGGNDLCRIEEESGEDIEQPNEAVLGTQNTRQVVGTISTSQQQPISGRLPILSLKQEVVRECFEKSPILKNINSQKSGRPNSEPGTLVPSRQMSPSPMMAKKTSKIPSSEYSSAPNFHGFIQRTGLQIGCKTPEAAEGPQVQQGTKLYTDNPDSSTSSRPTTEPKGARPPLA